MMYSQGYPMMGYGYGGGMGGGGMGMGGGIMSFFTFSKYLHVQCTRHINTHNMSVFLARHHR